MYGVWKAPLTAMGSTFLAPRSLAAVVAAATTPSADPAITT